MKYFLNTSDRSDICRFSALCHSIRERRLACLQIHPLISFCWRWIPPIKSWNYLCVCLRAGICTKELSERTAYSKQNWKEMLRTRCSMIKILDYSKLGVPTLILIGNFCVSPNLTLWPRTGKVKFCYRICNMSWVNTKPWSLLVVGDPRRTYFVRRKRQSRVISSQ